MKLNLNAGLLTLYGNFFSWQYMVDSRLRKVFDRFEFHKSGSLEDLYVINFLLFENLMLSVIPTASRSDFTYKKN